MGGGGGWGSRVGWPAVCLWDQGHKRNLRKHRAVWTALRNREKSERLRAWKGEEGGKEREGRKEVGREGGRKRREEGEELAWSLLKQTPSSALSASLQTFLQQPPVKLVAPWKLPFSHQGGIHRSASALALSLQALGLQI